MNTVRRIVVVGGGSAGWMTAAALCTGLRGVQVEVVESEEIGIIGVGEATFPSIRAYNQVLGIAEAEFLAATRGTYKLGIQFRNWRQGGEHYYHTFGDLGALDGPMALWGQYLRQHRAGAFAGPLSDLCLPSVMAREGRFTVPTGQGLSAQFTYAYHFDATLYATFLRRLSEQRGARRTEGRVVQVQRHEDGRVSALTLADGRRVEGDFFIDCSGFRSLLLGEALGVPFVDESRLLPVNRAWAMPVARVEGAPLLPYTQSTALEGGWAWRIPLQDRTGYGHVFSTAHISEERALEQLRAHVDGAPLAEPRLLRFCTGYRERCWAHNVVAVGLSAGFLEPLESTAIFLVQSTIGGLIPLLGEPASITPAVVAGFNQQQQRLMQRVRDFIVLHYHLTQRRDAPLWRDMAALEPPPTLAYKLRAWRQAGHLAVFDQEGFDGHSWLAIHAGMAHWPEHTSPWLAEVPAEVSAAYVQQRREGIDELVRRMPAHDAFLRGVTASR